MTQPVTGTFRGAWTTGTDYYPNDTVIYSGTEYSVATRHTSGQTFDYSKVTARQVNTDHGNGAAAAGGVETLSRFGLADLTGVSGQLWVSYVTADVTATITKLMVASGSVAASSTTLARLGLFSVAANGDLTLVARTASDNTIGGSTFTPYEKPLATAGGYPASYTIVAGQRYGMAFLQLATTAMNIMGSFVQDYSTPPICCATATGQSDIAATYAAASVTPTFVQTYMRGRP